MYLAHWGWLLTYCGRALRLADPTGPTLLTVSLEALPVVLLQRTKLTGIMVTRHRSNQHNLTVQLTRKVLEAHRT